eukprot:TRINITY_DN23035_c0_g1_i2.p1 TRINITY_DN23035_c0_g1~~TRINITY_DN23035_c0_g1_i2.p1  ORF type:complete len:218 (-),score=46.05 TRINITY_DN23035_c0_g1_i2:214-867(-)
MYSSGARAAPGDSPAIVEVDEVAINMDAAPAQMVAGHHGGFTLIRREIAGQVVARVGRLCGGGALQMVWRFEESTRLLLRDVLQSQSLAEIVTMVASEIVKLEPLELQGLRLRNAAQLQQQLTNAIRDNDTNFIQRHIRLMISPVEHCAAMSPPWAAYKLIWTADLERYQVHDFEVRRKVSTVDDEVTFFKVILTDQPDSIPATATARRNGGTCQLL